MKKTTKWAALVAAVAVMGAMPGCSNTEEPEVDPRDAYVGTYDLVSQSGSMTISVGGVNQTMAVPDWGMETMTITKVGDGNLVDVGGLEATLTDERLIFTKPLSHTQTEDDFSFQYSVNLSGRMSGGNAMTIDGDISGYGTYSNGVSAVVSGDMLLVYSK